MLLPAAVSAVYKEWDVFKIFLLCALPVILAGQIVMRSIPSQRSEDLRMRDGFFIVGVSWLAMSLIGAIPFVLSGAIPDIVDAYFETASGFTTTGSTILTEIEHLPRGILFWRSFTHWLGGMGVLVLTIAILPKLGIGGQKIMRAETTGPTMDKISFTVNDTARTLYKIYLVITGMEVVLLLFGGMDLFDALVHTFGTVGTGGFSSYNASIGAFKSDYIEWVIGIVMMMCGVNFSLYSNIYRKTPGRIFKDPEFRVYVGIIGVSTAFITVMLMIHHFYDGFAEALRSAFFQVSSIMTTTGYGTTDFDLWPLPCKFVLLLLMLVGGCAGSTGGGMKVIRAILVYKLVRRGVFRKLHPRAVSPIKVGDTTISAETMSGVAGFVILFLFTTVISTALISLEGVSLTTALSSVIACLSNIGPGFEAVGATQNFAFYSAPAKLLLSVLMIAGRLELFTVILLFTPVYWSRKK
jgi:trk system potassium uptake protein TrkH